MAADLEREACGLSGSCNHPLITCHAQRRQALRNEYIAARLALALQTAQSPELAPIDRMNAGRPALGAADMQFAGLEVDVVPSQGHKLTRT